MTRVCTFFCGGHVGARMCTQCVLVPSARMQVYTHTHTHTLKRTHYTIVQCFLCFRQYYYIMKDMVWYIYNLTSNFMHEAI
jgi:hypothetical protein